MSALHVASLKCSYKCMRDRDSGISEFMFFLIRSPVQLQLVTLEERKHFMCSSLEITKGVGTLRCLRSQVTGSIMFVCRDQSWDTRSEALILQG